MSVTIAKNIKAFLERATATGQECYAWVDAHQFVQAMIADLEKTPAGPVTEVSNAEMEP
jgi:hypothetical protein